MKLRAGREDKRKLQGAHEALKIKSEAIAIHKEELVKTIGNYGNFEIMKVGIFIISNYETHSRWTSFKIKGSNLRISKL